MEPALLLFAVFSAGFVAAIYAWPELTAWVHGAEGEAARLKAQADALLAKTKIELGGK
jgi:hypothetical protein